MRPIPRERAIDSSIALKRNPYGYIGERCRQHGADVFEARLLLQRTLCMTGPDAARLFYDNERFMRQGAAPEPLRATLFGKGAIQALDGEAHARRKAAFMSIVAPDRVAALARMTASEWESAAHTWTQRGRIRLYHEAQKILMRAVCEWAGVALPPSEVEGRTDQLVSLFDDAARNGWTHVRSRVNRKRAEHWLMAHIDRARRNGTRQPADALHAIAALIDANGQLLPLRVAAVELLNVLRPTVAVSVFVAFVAHALHQHPQCVEPLRGEDDAYLSAFVDEVRRYYPFFPAVAARTRHEFEWDGYRFPADIRVMLDLYGTNHDARAWQAPNTFAPERFATHEPGPFEFVPQGGGDPRTGHRCPGEGIAVALMKAAVRFLATRITYQVPRQDVSIDMTRLPALPHDGFVIADVVLS